MRRQIALFGMVLLVAMGASTVALADNPYEGKLTGKWEVENEADLFVFEGRNICFRMDEDGIKTSENGRWSATSKKLTTEVKYNGNKYRTVFEYEEIDKDTFKLVIITAFTNGEKQEVKKKEVIARRWKDDL